MKTSTLEKFAWIVGPLCFVGAASLSLEVSTPSHWFGAKSEDTSEWLAWFGLAALVVAVIQLILTKNSSDAAKEASEKSVGAIRRLDAVYEINSMIATADRAIDAFDSSNYAAAQRVCNEWLDGLARLKPLNGQLPFQSGENLDTVGLVVTSARNYALRGGGHETQQVADALREQKRLFLTLAGTLRQNLSES